MARPLRIEFAGAVYHVTARGNAQEDIYRDDSDRQQFLMLLLITVNQLQLILSCLLSDG
jgi:putative transposase